MPLKSWTRDADLLLNGTLPIRDDERDHSLLGTKDPAQWAEHKRGINILDDANHALAVKDGKAAARGTLEEHLLLWPAAPIYGLGSPREHLIPRHRPAAWHTMRLLKRPGQQRIDRVYIFFNGLNEWSTFQTYYRLADLLFLNEERRRREKNEEGFVSATSACIIRPFPAHLTRHPFTSSFYKLPMAHYLEDAAELYRQFLRHMVETQWLLSALVPFDNIPLKTGLDLLVPGKRSDPVELAGAIRDAWHQLAEADKEAAQKPADDAEPIAGPDGKLLAGQIMRLRNLVSWRPAPADWHTEANFKKPLFCPLSINAIGYSMGGFVAQATMFTWPQVLATCTMLASGGSLSNVQAAFVHEDEWIYVLDRLLPDLENPALARQIPIKVPPGASSRVPTTIYGLPRGYYSAFRRAFDQIFLQRSMRRREYRDWLEEYHDRLLFVLGGRDPVVKVASVIESAPPSGLNAIEVAGLNHELHNRELKDWQKFWFPKIVTRSIEHFVRRREKGHYHRLRTHWLDPVAAVAAPADGTAPTRDPRPEKEKSVRRRQEMSLARLEDELVSAFTWMREFPTSGLRSGRINPDLFQGFVVVARNRVPVELLPDTFLQRYGVVHHYSEERVADAEGRRRERRVLLEDVGDRCRILVPEDFVEIETRAVGGPLAQWPDATGGNWSPDLTRDICSEMEGKWKERLLLWAPHETSADTLPDCWYFFARGWMARLDIKATAGWAGVMKGISTTIKRVNDGTKSVKDAAIKPAGDDAARPPKLSKLQIEAQMNEVYTEFLSETRIFRVSQAHTGAHYAGYEIFDGGEKLLSLEHLAKVVTNPAQATKARG